MAERVEVIRYTSDTDKDYFALRRKNPDGSYSAIDLSGSPSILLKVREPDGDVNLLSGSCTVEGSPDLGTVGYQWGSADLPDPGFYDAQFDITLEDLSRVHSEIFQITVKRGF